MYLLVKYEVLLGRLSGAMPNPVLDQQRVWKLLSSGVHEVARIVAKTYGPMGGKVMVQKAGSVLVTTDGAALTRESQLAGVKRLGAALVRSAAIKTEEQVGDGTSTTVLLADSLIKQIGLRACVYDWDPVKVVAQIRAAHEVAENEIRAMSRTSDRDCLDRVAFMASHEDPLIAEKVVEAVLAVGEEGSVVISPYEGTGIVLEQKEGLYLNQGWASFEMAPDEGTEREMDGPLVAVFRRPLRRMADIASAMEQASQWPGRGLLVFAPRVQGEALKTLLVNSKKGVLSCAAVEYAGSPADLDDWLEDLATVTNATIIDPNTGMNPESFEAPWLGSARRITLTKDHTLVVSYLDDNILQKIDQRALQLRARAESTQHPFEKDRLIERASALDGGLCTLRVGGFTKQEGQDRRSRVEDALKAVQTCLRGGVIPGAGLAFFRAAIWLPQDEGGAILRHALRSVLGTLVKRAGVEPAIVFSEGMEVALYDPDGWFGYDPLKKDWRDFWEESPRVVDPTEVMLAALRNAVSVACQMALCGGVVSKSIR
jgi:chaperonin GroEL